MVKAKITVIVPVYNVEKYLRKCLDSLIDQTYKNIKIVCVNDGSTDSSAKILEEYQKKDSRILIINKENGGLSSARNAALKKCDTEYVMFCDSDDTFSLRMCEKMLTSIEEDNSDIAVCTQNVIYHTHEEMRESDRNYYRLNYYGKNEVDDELIIKTDVSVLNKIFRTSIINKNNISFPEGINNEDFYFYNAYMSVSKTVTFVNQRLYNYVRRANSIMSSNFEAEHLSLDHLLSAEKLFDFYEKTGFIKEHADLFWQQWVQSFWFSIEHTSDNHKTEVKTHAREFANKYFNDYLPNNPKVVNEVKYIINNSIISKVKRKARQVLASTYKKVNIKYRQQSYINAELETIQTKNNELVDRIENLRQLTKLN